MEWVYYSQQGKKSIMKQPAVRLWSCRGGGELAVGCNCVDFVITSADSIDFFVSCVT